MCKDKSEDPYKTRDVDYEEIHSVTEASLLKMINAAKTQGSCKVLDCGCGYGALSKVLLDKKPASSSITLDLLDESKYQLTKAICNIKKWNKEPTVTVRFLRGLFPSDDFCLHHANQTAKDLPEINTASSVSLSPGYYDIIFLKMMLHDNTQEDQGKILKGLHHLLRPNGQLILWEMIPEPEAGDFVRNVMKKKDELAGYDELAKRRYFADCTELYEILKQSPFVLYNIHHVMNYTFDSKKRLSSELNNDYGKLGTLNTYIKKEAAKLDKTIRTHMNYTCDDSNKTVCFDFNMVIITARRSDTGIHLLHPLRHRDELDRNTHASVKKEPKQLIRDAVKKFLEEDSLPDVIGSEENSSGIIRINYFLQDENGADSKDTVVDDLDYVYFNKNNDYKMNYYAAYVAAAFCIAKLSTQQDYPGVASWLRKSVLGETTASGWLGVEILKTQHIEVTSGGYNIPLSLVKINLSKKDITTVCDAFKKIVYAVPAINQDQLKITREIFFRTYDTLTLKKMSTAGNTTIDGVAKEIADNLNDKTDIKNAIKQIIDVSKSIKVKKIIGENYTDKTNDIYNIIPLLLSLYAFMGKTKNTHCYYLTPPSIFKEKERCEKGVFTLSLNEGLSGAHLRSILEYVVGLWRILDFNMLEYHWDQRIISTRRAARTAILARNFSHVMGSHVISNPDFIEAMIGKKTIDQSHKQLQKWIDKFDKVTDDYITTGYESGDTQGYWTKARAAISKTNDMLGSGGTLTEQSRRFHHYLQGRFDFIARSIDETEDSVEPVYFINDLIDGFLTQTAFLDTLVSDLGVRLPKINFCIEFEDGKAFKTEWTYDSPKARNDKENNKDYKWINESGTSGNIEESDFMIGLPGGMIASQAFYALLENVIRNSVKYNSKQAEKNAYQLIIKIEDTNKLEKSPLCNKSAYQLTIYDNFSGGSETYHAVLEHAQNDIIDDNGKQQTEGLGIQEMKICAENLLPKSIRNILAKGYKDHENDKDKYEKTPYLRPNNDGGKLTFELNMAKPILIAVCTNRTSNIPQSELIRTSDTLDNLVDVGAHILIIDGETFDNIAENLEKNFNVLPYRLLVVYKNNDKCEECIGANNLLTHRIKAICLDDISYNKLIPSSNISISDKDYIIACYDAWLRAWKPLPTNKSGEEQKWDLWLGFQRSGSQISDTWKPLLKNFNSDLINIFVRNKSDAILSSDNNIKIDDEYWDDELDHSNKAKKALVFDNHGECFNDAYRAESTEDFRKSTRFYQKFGSVTPDLYRILSSPPASDFGFAFFIYSLVESCLTNVGIVDERVAGDLLFDNSKTDSLKKSFPKDLASHQKAGVFPIFKFYYGENYTKHDGYYSDRHKTVTPLNVAEIIKKDSDIQIQNTQDTQLDVLIIHEGALDLLLADGKSIDQNAKEKIGKALLKIVPSVIRTSGRGRHTKHFDENLPFIEFNEVSSALLTSRNKYSLVRGLLGTTGDQSKADDNTKEK